MKDTLRLFHNPKFKKNEFPSFCTLAGSFILTCLRTSSTTSGAFVRNQSASSLMQMMQSNHAIDIGLQEAEPILNIINMNNSTIHHNQDSNQTVSNTTHPLSQNTMQNQTVSHTIDELQNTLTWQDKSLCTLNENHSSYDDSDIEDLEGDFSGRKNINNTN